MIANPASKAWLILAALLAFAAMSPCVADELQWRQAFAAAQQAYRQGDLPAAERSHARRLFLKHRRPELYRDWIK